MRAHALLTAGLMAAGLALPLNLKAQEGPPVLLLVPLIAPAEAEGWMGPALDRILEEKLHLVEGLSFPAAERRKEALREIAESPRVGVEELIAATEIGGADYAIVGQFIPGEGTIVLDVRIFSASEKRQTASVVRERGEGEVFRLLGETALALAAELGVEVPEESAPALLQSPTSSLEAYHHLYTARTEEDASRRLELLRRAIALDGNYLDANLKLGLELYGEGWTEDALPFMEKAAALGPEVPETHNNLAVLYARLGRREDALAEFEKALKIKPDYPEAYLNYGRLLEESGRLDRAEGVYTDLLGKDPDNVKARSSLALLYERTGRTELAIQEFRVLSRKSPELAEEYFLQSGRDARKAKEFQKAERFFQRVVDINPQLSQGYAEMGTNSYLAGAYDRSLEHFRKALALEPQRGEYHYYLGLAEEKSGLQEEAARSYLRAVELGGPPEARVSLARMYIAEGEVGRAIDELNLVLDEDPTQAAAKELLARAMDRAESEQRKEHQRAELATRRLERLESIVEDLTSANRELENRLLSQRRDRQDLERELEQLRSERGQYGERMEEALRSIEELSGNSEVEQLRAKYREQVKSLEEELASVRETIASGQVPAASSSGEDTSLLEQERLTSSSLEKTAEALQRQLQEREETSRRLAEEVEGLRDRDGERTAEIARLQSEFAALELAKDEEGRELSRLAAEAEGLGKKVAEREGEIARLQSEVAALELGKGEGARELSRLEELNRSLTERIDALEKEASRLRADLEDSRKEGNRLRAEGSESVRETANLLERLGELRGEKEFLEKEFALTQTSYEELSGRVAEMEGEVEALRADLGAARGRSDDLQERLNAAVAERDGEIAALRDRERQAAQESESLRQRIADLEADLDAREGVREALERARRDLVLQALDLGRLHMASRSWEKAGLYFQRVVEADPRNGEAYYSLGEIYFQLGRFELSKEMYQRAKEIY